MTDALLRDLERYADAARRLEGWVLEYEPEPLRPGPPWDYKARASELCARAGTLLDLGTGGGEVLSRLLAASRARAVATEWWHVNAPVAGRRLAGRAPVVRTSSLELPFADSRFDLVLSRHEELAPSEVARVLAPGGRLLTQQVIPDPWPELREFFPDMTRFPDHYAGYQRGLQEAGLAIEEAREFRHPVRFHELGHLVYHLVAAPWTLPGFSIDTHGEPLARLSVEFEREGGLVLTDGLYLLQAAAP
ncbi:MAG: class I SAM-dependent methyltransferase [Deltaproteobacteria bacterium]|nr:class I SAM-dependent methyltransferase [Deltaproteobacteria bacterium]MBW2415668.1 class I SAM-dependent methyltransferase [Deltaproteobacteria bacterium]